MVRLRLFGSPRLEREDGTAVTGRATQRHRLALLALLSLAPGTRLRRDKVMAWLWPEADAERARNLLNVSSYVLRSALGEGSLVSAGDDLHLDGGVVHSDAAEFVDAMARGDHARAVALHTGPFLDGFFLSEAPEFEEWAEQERRRLGALHGKALEALADEAEGAGDFGTAVERWRARAAHDPFDSRVALRLMHALDAAGNRAGAIQHAASHQRLLREELGAAPAPDVAALAERLQGEPAPTRVAATAPATSSAAAAASSSSGRNPSTPTLPTAVPAARRSAGSVLLPLAILALIVAAWWLWPRGSAPERSIVVLPFLNMSPDEDIEHFSDGLTEEVIARLSSVRELKVISRTSAMHYKDRQVPLRQIASELGVAHVLEGSVRQSGGRVRITVQLIDARDDSHRWAENYDYALEDILRVQEEIAREVVRAFAVDPGTVARQRLGRRGTRDPEAYDLFLRGRFLLNMRTQATYERAADYLRRAIERDPNYSEAYAAMAKAYLIAYQYNLSDLSEAEAYSRFKWAAERAIALDDQSADAHASLAVALWWQKNWPGAERELRRALALDGGNASALGWLSLLLAGQGKLEEALALNERATVQNPFSDVGRTTYGHQLYNARNYDAAIEQNRRALEINASWQNAYRGLALAYAQKRMTGEAIRAARTAAEMDPDNGDIQADLAYVLALGGRRDEAAASLRRAKEQAWEGFTIARAHVALGEVDSAFAWLDRSSWTWPHRAIRTDPALDPLREDPRFARLSERVEREMGLR